MKSQITSINDLNLIKELGRGSYGAVFLTKVNNRDKAIKIITSDRKEGIRSLVEIDLMSKLVHPNLTHAEGILVSITEDVKTGIIMPLADTDLQKLMFNSGFARNQRLKVLFDITNGVQFLHNSGYLHLDLKPLNILIFDFDRNRINAKLSDFGLTLISESGAKYYPSELVTITHRSPEILEGDRNYTVASDIWALGIIFLEVISSKVFHRHFSTSSVKNNNNRLSSSNIDGTLNYFLGAGNNEIKRLIRGMLQFDPRKRMSSQEILRSSLFKNFKKPVGIVKYARALPPRTCNILYYYGFDYLIRLALNFSLKTETIFLAGDIYQRSLAYANKLTGNSSIDWPNVALVSTTSLYMAIKTIEPVYTEISVLSNLSMGMFNDSDVLRTEAALTQLFQGIIYSKNLFTETFSKSRLELGFEVLRNCHIYHLVDLDRWKELSHGDYQKYIYFSEFIKGTNYYQLMLNRNQNDYLNELFSQDLNYAK